MLSGIDFKPEQRPGKVEVRLERECGVAFEEVIAVAKQKMAVLERPKVADAIVHGPHRLCLDRPLGQLEHHGANLPFDSFVSVGKIAPQQARHAEGEQQPVLVEEIERGHRIPRAHIDGAGPCESEWINRNGERRRQGGLIGEAVDEEALFDRR